MTDRDRYWLCALSFFRNRHALTPRYKKTRRRKPAMDLVFEDHCRMVRHYIEKIRELDRKESPHATAEKG